MVITILYCFRILCSQLPPEMGEKLLLVASGGVEVRLVMCMIVT